MNLPVKNIVKTGLLYKAVSSFLGNKIDKVEDKMEDIGLIEKRNVGSGIFFGALAGLAVGAGAALLLAKQSGTDFRSTLKKRFDNTKEKLIAKKDDTLLFAKKEAENVKKAVASKSQDFTPHQ